MDQLTYCLLLGQISRGTKDHDDRVVLELHGPGFLERRISHSTLRKRIARLGESSWYRDGGTSERRFVAVLGMGGQPLSSKYCSASALFFLWRGGSAGSMSTYAAAESRSDMMSLGEGKQEKGRWQEDAMRVQQKENTAAGRKEEGRTGDDVKVIRPEGSGRLSKVGGFKVLRTADGWPCWKSWEELVAQAKSDGLTQAAAPAPSHCRGVSAPGMLGPVANLPSTVSTGPSHTSRSRHCCLTLSCPRETGSLATRCWARMHRNRKGHKWIFNHMCSTILFSQNSAFGP